MAVVGTREINNIECEIQASVHGSWSIYRVGEEPNNERYLATDDVLDKAVNKARIEIKKQQVKVAVPFKTMDGRRGIASGRHARSRGKILTKIGNKSEQIESRSQILKHDTPKDVIDHLKELAAEQVKLRKEERDLYNEWKLDLGNAVDAAVKEAIEEGEKAA
jgi:hypothetical protein